MSTKLPPHGRDGHTVEPPTAEQPIRNHEASKTASAVPAGSSPGNHEASEPTTDAPDSPVAGATAAPQSSILGWIARKIPPLIVIAALAGVAYWGHHTEWKIPKFPELSGGPAAPEVPWCDEHGVPEADCIACNADLMPKGKLYGWCKEHGVHECVLDHPDLAQLPKPPVVTQADLDRAARALATRPRPENDPTCKMHLRRIQFPSIEAVDKAGIDIGLVDRGPVVESIDANGEVVFDPTRVARLASRAAGTVWQVLKNVGEPVQQGEILALVDAQEVGRAKSELLQAVTELDFARQTYQRIAGLDTIVAGKRLLEAETAVKEAEVAVQKAIQTLVNLGLPVTYSDVRQTPTEQLERKLQFVGISDDITAGLDPDRTTSNLLPLVAPRDGIVVNRDVVVGEVVETTKTLFTVADTRQMWLVLDVPLEDMPYVATGQQVVFRPDGTDHADHGRLTWISTEVDRETRTVQARAELSNEDGHLRNETFGAGEIILREESEAILVPSSAVHWEGCCFVAFVRDKDWFNSPYKVFHTRSVRPGVVMGDKTEIIAGLLPGEVIVTEGSAVLRAELLKGNLGAG